MNVCGATRSQKPFRRSSPFIVSILVTGQRNAEAAKHCCPKWTRSPRALIFFRTELKRVLPFLWEVRIIINLEQVQGWVMGKSCGRRVLAA